MAEAMDFSEVRRFASDLATASGRIDKDVRAVIVKGALNIKRQLQAEMGQSAHFKGAAQSISFDLTGNAFYTEARIGPSSDDGSAGNLANIAYFGGALGGGTVPDPQLALEAEVPNFEKALGDILGGLL